MARRSIVVVVVAVLGAGAVLAVLPSFVRPGFVAKESGALISSVD